MYGILIGALLFVGVGTLTYFGPDIKEYFGVRYQKADRAIFDQSKSQIKGTIQNLRKLQYEYETSDNEAHKKAIRQMILDEYYQMKYRNELPDRLIRFINNL